MERGYIKLWRKLTDSAHFSFGLKHIGMFDYLLLKANWKPGWFMGVRIGPGELGTSITKLAETLCEQRRTVRRLLDDLEKHDMIKRQPIANRWTHITICNWQTYQQEANDDVPTESQQVSSNVPANAQQMPHNQRRERSKEGKEVNNRGSSVFKPPTLEQVREYFAERGTTIDPDEFWNHYEANGWFRGKTKIKNWKACLVTWEKSNAGAGAGGKRLSGNTTAGGRESSVYDSIGEVIDV